MSVVKGKIGNAIGSTLRNTGCSCVIGKQSLISESQYMGRRSLMQMVDSMVKRVPIVRVEMDTPYLSGTVDALCPPTAIYDIITGNVSGVRAVDDPDSR